MYIPKKTRLEMFLKRKASCKSNKNNNGDNQNWSETCKDFIKNVMVKRQTSTKSQKSISERDHEIFLDHPNLCLEFNKSYVSFPEFTESAISSSESTTNSERSTTQSNNVWSIPSSYSFSSYSSSRI